MYISQKLQKYQIPASKSIYQSQKQHIIQSTRYQQAHSPVRPIIKIPIYQRVLSPLTRSHTHTHTTVFVPSPPVYLPVQTKLVTPTVISRPVVSIPSPIIKSVPLAKSVNVSPNSVKYQPQPNTNMHQFTLNHNQQNPTQFKIPTVPKSTLQNQLPSIHKTHIYTVQDQHNNFNFLGLTNTTTTNFTNTSKQKHKQNERIEIKRQRITEIDDIHVKMIDDLCKINKQVWKQNEQLRISNHLLLYKIEEDKQKIIRNINGSQNGDKDGNGYRQRQVCYTDRYAYQVDKYNNSQQPYSFDNNYKYNLRGNFGNPNYNNYNTNYHHNNKNNRKICYHYTQPQPIQQPYKQNKNNINRPTISPRHNSKNIHKNYKNKINNQNYTNNIQYIYNKKNKRIKQYETDADSVSTNVDNRLRRIKSYDQILNNQYNIYNIHHLHKQRQKQYVPCFANRCNTGLRQTDICRKSIYDRDKTSRYGQQYIQTQHRYTQHNTQNNNHNNQQYSHQHAQQHDFNYLQQYNNIRYGLNNNIQCNSTNNNHNNITNYNGKYKNRQYDAGDADINQLIRQLKKQNKYLKNIAINL